MIFFYTGCDPAPFYLFDELDQALDSTYRASVARMIQQQANNKETLDTMAKNGINVVAPSAALKADLRKIGATMLAEWEKNAGADAKAVLDAYRK